MDRHGFAAPADIAERRGLVVEGFRDELLEVEPLGDGEGLVGDFDRTRRLVVAEEGPRKVGQDRGSDVLMAASGQSLQAGLEYGHCVADSAGIDERLPELRARASCTRGVSRSVVPLERLPRERLRPLVVPGEVRRARALEQQLRLLHRVRGDLQRLLGEGDSLVMGTKAFRAFGGATKGEPRLGGDRVGLFARRRGLEGGQVVARLHARQLVLADRLDETCRGDVACAAVAATERAVGDLADERLDEPVLATLRRSGVGFDLEQLPTDKGAQSRLELLRAGAVDGCQTGQREDLPEHRRVLQDGAIDGLERVEAGGDQRPQRLGNGQGPQVADRPVAVVDTLQASV